MAVIGNWLRGEVLLFSYLLWAVFRCRPFTGLLCFIVVIRVVLICLLLFVLLCFACLTLFRLFYCLELSLGLGFLQVY